MAESVKALRPSWLTVVVVCLTACGSRTRAEPPSVDVAPAPILSGTTVMVFPVQEGPVPSAPTQKHWVSERAKLDAEIAYWLPQTAGRVRWRLPADIQRVLARSPGLGIQPDQLAVGSFRQAQVKRIGDPLFGDLRRLAAVMDAPLALIPVAAEFIGESESSAQLHIAAAVIDAMDGNVLWFGIITGETGTVGADATVASAAQAFGRAFAPRQN